MDADELRRRLLADGIVRIGGNRWSGARWCLIGLIGIGFAVTLLISAHRDGELSGGILFASVVTILLAGSMLVFGLRLVMDRDRVVLDRDGVATKTRRVAWADILKVATARTSGRGAHPYVVLTTEAGDVFLPTHVAVKHDVLAEAIRARAGSTELYG